MLDLRHNNIVYGDDLAQGWVTTTLSQGAGFQSGMAAAPLDRVCGE